MKFATKRRNSDESVKHVLAREWLGITTDCKERLQLRMIRGTDGKMNPFKHTWTNL